MITNKYFAQFDSLWPSLLTPLIEQQGGESLERLQLISIELYYSKDIQVSFQRERFHIDGNNFIKLFNNNIKIIYFVRGAKKYFKSPINFIAKNLELINIIDENNIRDYYIRDNNNFFYDKDLAYLNGHNYIAIPAPMIIATLLKYIDKLEVKLRSLSITFYALAKAGQILSIGYEINNSKLSVGLYADKELVAVLN
jgi:hypothetical protein